MSVKICVSYETPEELQRVQKMLHPTGMKWRLAEQKGRYKRAYATDSPRKRKLEKIAKMLYNSIVC